MARYVNLYKEKSLVIRKAYNCEYGDWIFLHEYMVLIETDDGRLRRLPVMSEDYLDDYTADEYLKEEEDESFRILMPEDCPRRDAIIRENITEWVVNQGCVDGSSIVEAVCAVVSLLTKFDMWKDEYAKCIDIKKIKDEYGEES